MLFFILINLLISANSLLFNNNYFSIKAKDGLQIGITSKYSFGNKYSLLFIHGSNAGSWVFEENWLNYFSENGYNSYAINMRGSNITGTINNKSFVTITEHVEDLKYIIDYFSHKNLILLGHSYGGLVMTKLFENKDYRDKIKGVIWMDSLPPSGISKLSFRFLFKNKLRKSLKLLVKIIYGDIFTNVGRNQLLFYDMCTSRKVVYEYMEKLKNDSFIKLDIMDLKDNLPIKRKFYGFNQWNNDTKKLVISSIDDYLIDNWSLKETANLVNAPKPYYFHGPGHNIMLGSRWREGADVILEYLESEFN